MMQNTEDKDYYEILGVEPTASQEEIKKAYRKKAKEYHPDKSINDVNSDDRFKEVTEAYEILGDSEKRQQYDEEDDYEYELDPVEAETETRTRELRVGGWKLVVMLLITWLAQLPGLGNLIFLWKDLRHRRRAAIALGVGLGAGVIPHVVVASSFGWPGNFFRLVYLGTAIWMTLDAIKAYNTYKRSARP
jgi:hypothetical protein